MSRNMAEPLEKRVPNQRVQRKHNLSKGLYWASILAFALTSTATVTTAVICAHYDGKSENSVTGIQEEDRNSRVSEDYGKVSLYLIPAFIIAGLAWGFADEYRREHEVKPPSSWF